MFKYKITADSANQIYSNKEIGASLVEYGLLVALIATVALASVRLFGQNLSTSYSQSNSAVSGAIA